MQVVSAFGIAAFIILAIVYPFLPGGYDSLALPLSLVLQGSSWIGLLFVPIGIAWLLDRARERRYARMATIVTVLIVIVASFVAWGTVGVSFLVIALVLGFAAWKLRTRLQPLHLVIVPVVVVVAQLLIFAKLTDWSRSHAIAQSNELIREIESYRARHGRYPVTLIAQHKDYSADVAGIEQFHYAPQGDSYNLFFEQPRFFFHVAGAREWVVYNPRDEHRMYSHAAWFLLATPEQMARSQGWYSMEAKSHPHWKSFLFD